MKRLSIGLCLAFLFLFFVPSSHAQTRYLVGAEGGDSFDNYNFGVTAGIEVPFLKHFELDLKDTFSPIESHVALGTGRANITTAGGIIWLTQGWGLTGSVEDSMYDVTKVTKDADYAAGGLVYRGIVLGLPARFSFKYINQFNNGVSPTGLETSQLKGGDITATVRFGCFGKTCVRLTEDFVFGRVLTQGNQNCDGSLPVVAPNVYCGPRAAAFGGGTTASIVFEFPRHRGHEGDVF